ncbi:SAM-dependent methyltransferase [Candidatus Sulfurimonas marisnigri]|uniref:SAM-dependent methyltransferase n=1 Tax=Candidatus Sulfurimonas marisnigri TaxID=2740405 RepID=A0A7S7LZJ1_9BACT|nr:SAM-dependent methyltransferase [Candidatus Sulfurimonas marisnigri]QOY53763.1 SAM-dependent methyltransferase [Candidatus Sulfurimonas marisnigri]
MKFSEYMAEWLYGEYGYYTTYKNIGKSGDFYTAVSTSKFFGGTIAKHIISLVDEGFLSENGTVCEIGAHHGYFLADVIEFIYTLRPKLLSTLKFVIIERFDDLQEFQKSYFEESFGDVVSLTHYKSLSELECENAFFIANEIFDAFPCELYYKGKTARVDGHNIEFDEGNEWVKSKAEKYHKDRGEIAVGYEEFAKEMASTCNKFEFMTFDYGEMSARPDFSLRVYAKHEVIPFFNENIKRDELFAKSDITYDVTFAHVKDAYEDAGVEFVEIKAQMVALVDMGILELLEMLEANVEEKIYRQELEKAKMLILPNFLGERFKMVRFRKN